MCASAQFCLTLCDPIDYSPPGSSVRELSRQEYWSGWQFPTPGDLSNPGTEPRSPSLQADSLPAEPPGSPGRMEWNTIPMEYYSVIKGMKY